MADERIDQMLQTLHMTDVASNYPDRISGGQKRRLQLMIALLGNFKIVLLDEPTSGMDPQLRRETWQILKQMKKDSVVILTTHYMDEAEFLGDRVAIMSGGKLKTCGTPLFLKNKFSHEFLIEVVKADPQKSLERFESLLSQCMQEISSAFTVPEFRVHRDEGNREVYTIPRETAEVFNSLFSKVDTDKEALNIAEYVVRTSSLEEVFIQIGEKEKAFVADPEHSHQRAQQIDVPIEPASTYEVFSTYCLMNLQARIGQCIVGAILVTIFMSIILV